MTHHNTTRAIRKWRRMKEKSVRAWSIAIYIGIAALIIIYILMEWNK